MLLKLVTPEAYFSFCLSSDLVGFTRSCKSGVLKYWTRAHLFRPLSFYRSRLYPLSSKEVKMKGNICAWYQRLGYVEGFGHDEVPLIRKTRNILIHV